MSKILILCKLVRAGGTRITMADKTGYHFKDDGEGNHVCIVSNKDHQAALLSHPEAYSFFGAADAGDDAGLGIDLPATIAVPETQEPLPVFEQPAISADLTATGLPEGSTAVVATQVAEQPQADTPQGQAEPTADDAPVMSAELEALSIEDLREVYKTEMGKAATASKKANVLISQILAVRAERAKQ